MENISAQCNLREIISLVHLGRAFNKYTKASGKHCYTADKIKLWTWEV